MISRSLKSAILHKSQLFSARIIVITGARQTGKTTLVKHTFPKMKYIAVDDPVLIGQYTSLTVSQWHEYYPQAILDEVQKIPALIESIKAVYDQFPDVIYILTGSSQFLHLNKVSESLADRAAIFELFPLTIPELMTDGWDDDIHASLFQEFLQKGLVPESLPSFLMDPEYAVREKAFQNYLLNGGYPVLTKNSFDDNERFEWLTDYIRTYLERDVRDLADFRSLEPFVKVQRMTALMTGNLLNYAELAKDAGITPNTARRFVNYLEISYQALLLEPWSRNKLKRLVKSPKLHYLDPGVQKAIIQKRGILSGNEYESAIIAELYKQMKNLQFPGSFYHLRTVDGREVDLLIETEKGYYAIEVKMTSRVSDGDARHLKGLELILDKPLLFSFLLSNDPVVRNISENILAIPAAMFLS
jgi:predicted AAA+ superfamily ATPase